MTEDHQRERIQAARLLVKTYITDTHSSKSMVAELYQ